jgi:hypothetical protein
MADRGRVAKKQLSPARIEPMSPAMSSTHTSNGTVGPVAQSSLLLCLSLFLFVWAVALSYLRSSSNLTAIVSMQMLKASFLENQVPSPAAKQELSEQLKLPLEQVNVWPHGTFCIWISWCCFDCTSTCHKTCKLQPLRCCSAENQGC